VLWPSQRRYGRDCQRVDDQGR